MISRTQQYHDRYSRCWWVVRYTASLVAVRNDTASVPIVKLLNNGPQLRRTWACWTAVPKASQRIPDVFRHRTAAVAGQ